jgi:hypothetical protein
MGAGKLDKENQGLRSQSDNQNTQISSLMAIIKELQGKIAAQPAATTGL